MNKIQKIFAWFLIPNGMYCHENTRGDPCPFWFLDGTKEVQENGYCSYLRKGDWMINEEIPDELEVTQGDQTYTVNRKEDKTLPYWKMSLLWDQCKDSECPRYE